MKINKIQQEWHLFLVCLSFFSRIPVANHLSISQQQLNHAGRYFVVVGLVIAAVSALVLWLTQLLLPIPIAVLISMASSILLTGAFHEDGFADTLDGFGGGWSSEQKLAIMKDSRLGTYGVIGLILILSLKWQLLVSITNHSLTSAIIALVIAHCLSRFIAISISFTEPYVQLNNGKSQSLTQPNNTDIKTLFLTSIVIIIWLPWLQIAILLGLLFAIRYLLVGIFRRQIAGYTGDTLGAAQQISEISIYMLLLLGLS